MTGQKHRNGKLGDIKEVERDVFFYYLTDCYNILFGELKENKTSRVARGISLKPFDSRVATNKKSHKQLLAYI